MPKYIYVIVRHYLGGKIEHVEAWENETQAREAASKLIPLKMDNFYYALNQVELKF